MISITDSCSTKMSLKLKIKNERLLTVVLSALTLVIITCLVLIAKDCSESGGDFVRGLIWFECIGGNNE